MTTENGVCEEDAFKSEVRDIKENIRNVSECLHTLIKRIDNMEHRFSDKLGPSIDTEPPIINVQRSESETNEGGMNKRIHVTHKVITSKKITSMGSSLDSGCAKVTEERVIGIRKPKGDNHLVSTAYSARLTTRVRSDPELGIDLLQGLTVRQQNGQLIVTQVADDSPLVKQGLVRLGDAIISVNGVDVTSPEDLAEKLGQAGDGVSLKIIPSGLDSCPPNATYIKSLTDYNPKMDDNIPCKDIGLQIKSGEIIEVINQDDPKYWQARKVNEWTIGLIPSGTISKVTGGKCQYEEVGKLSPYGRRTLVLIGAPGVGRRTLKTMLLAQDPSNFATVTPYTSRNPRPGEQEGREYHFINQEKMKKDISEGRFLEWGEFNANCYGTSLESVRAVMRSGRLCVLDCSPQAIKHLHSWEFMPYIVFVAPPPFEELKQLYQVHPNRTKPKSDEDLRHTCEESAKIQEQHKQYFDLMLCNRNVDVTFRRLTDALESLKTDTQWVPVSWLYGP